MELVGGAFIFLAFIIVMLIALIAGLYTRSGSGIDEHPYGKQYGGAPGANTDNRRLTGRDGLATMSSRGTR